MKDTLAKQGIIVREAIDIEEKTPNVVLNPLDTFTWRSLPNSSEGMLIILLV